MVELDRRHAIILSEIISNHSKYLPMSKDIISSDKVIARFSQPIPSLVDPSNQKKSVKNVGFFEAISQLPFESDKANRAFMLLCIHNKPFFQEIDGLWSGKSSLQYFEIPSPTFYGTEEGASPDIQYPAPSHSGTRTPRVSSTIRLKRSGDIFVTNDVKSVIEVMSNLVSSGSIGGVTIVYDKDTPNEMWTSEKSSWSPPSFEESSEMELGKLQKVFREFLANAEAASISTSKSGNFKAYQKGYESKGHWVVREKSGKATGKLELPNDFFRHQDFSKGVIEMIARWKWEWVVR